MLLRYCRCHCPFHSEPEDSKKLPFFSLESSGNVSSLPYVLYYVCKRRRSFTLIALVCKWESFFAFALIVILLFAVFVFFRKRSFKKKILSGGNFFLSSMRCSRNPFLMIQTFLVPSLHPFTHSRFDGCFFFWLKASFFSFMHLCFCIIFSVSHWVNFRVEEVFFC